MEDLTKMNDVELFELLSKMPKEERAALYERLHDIDAKIADIYKNKPEIKKLGRKAPKDPTIEKMKNIESTLLQINQLPSELLQRLCALEGPLHERLLIVLHSYINKGGELTEKEKGIVRWIAKGLLPEDVSRLAEVPSNVADILKEDLLQLALGYVHRIEKTADRAAKLDLLAIAHCLSYSIIIHV